MARTLTQTLDAAENALANGALQQACDGADVILANDPQHVDALEIKAMALGEMGEADEAEVIFELILNREPHRMPTLIAAT